MVKNIIFDFGDVFINLDKSVVVRELMHLGDPELLEQLKVLNDAYEIGAISTKSFLDGLQRAFPSRDRETLSNLWNAMLLDFPEYRLKYLQELANNGSYRLFLLSNTNELHIRHVKEKMGPERFALFKNSFEGFHLSHEIQMRKPDKAIFEFVLENHGLHPGETFFVDDTQENIRTALEIGIKSWHLQVGKEDITSLLSKI